MSKFLTVFFIVILSFFALAQSSLHDYGPAGVTGNSIIPVHQLSQNILLDQEPNQVNGLFADETCELCPTGQQTIAENFFQPAYAVNIDFIMIWGGYYPEDIPNIVDDFTIIVHSDASGQPGAVLWTRTGLQPDRTQTGVVLFGTHEYMFYFFIDNFWFPPGTGKYWIELFNNSTESGNFYWETGNLDVTYGVAGSASYTTTPGTSWNLDPYSDLGIIITINWIPVELVSFQAIASGSDVNLNWVTATETNNRGFAIQRSSGGEFGNIGFVQGNGTTTENHAYSYTDENVNVGTYSYRLMQIDYDGTVHYSNVVDIDVHVPASFALHQNYPNPFNPSTKIKYQIPQTSQVQIKVFDVLGNEIETLVNEEEPAGNYEVTWDAANHTSGIYFYKLQSGNFVETKKMVLTK
jgi:hypothetical protein